MKVADVIVDSFERIREAVHEVVDGLTSEQLAFRADAEANSIAWLVWHLTRVQDDHIADAAQVEQVWTSGGWAERFHLPFPPSATGYRHSADEVGSVQVESPELLVGYHDAVYDRTVAFVGGIEEADLGRIVDEAWDPPVSLGVRLVSVISDDLQHSGQATYVRGLMERSRPL